MDKQVVQFRCVNDLVEAEKLWRSFSPEETIYDDWEFRALFQKYHQKEIRFYAGYIDGECIGCLPLQFNEEKKWIEFFGGDYMEDNRLFLRAGYEMYHSDFYDYLKTLGEVIHLESIRGTDAFTTALEIQDYKYVLSLEGITNFEDYLQKYYQSHGRKKLKKKFKNIDELHVSVEQTQVVADLETLFALNIKQFEDHSSFNDRPFHREIFYDLCTMQYPFFLNIFSCDGKKIGASFTLLYKNTMEYFSSGVDRDVVEGLGDYVTKTVFEDALQNGATHIDAFMGNYGWKERWHFTAIPQYKFIIE